MPLPEGMAAEAEASFMLNLKGDQNEILPLPVRRGYRNYEEMRQRAKAFLAVPGHSGRRPASQSTKETHGHQKYAKRPCYQDRACATQLHH
jgi:hypothetical protein